MARRGMAWLGKARQGFLNAHTHLQGKKMHLNIATGVLQLTPTEYDSMLQHRVELLAAKIAEVEAGRKELLNALYAHRAKLNGGRYKEINGYAVVSWDTNKLTISASQREANKGGLYGALTGPVRPFTRKLKINR